MSGLNIYKNGKDPVAMADSEYPQWLWQLARDYGHDRQSDADILSKDAEDWETMAVDAASSTLSEHDRIYLMKRRFIRKQRREHIRQVNSQLAKR